MWSTSLFRRRKQDPEISRYVKKYLGFVPNNTAFYQLAFRHSSAAKSIKSKNKESNERLEFLGDAILDSIVAHYLFLKFPKLNEGTLTKMKSKVVSRRNLNNIGKKIHLPDQLDLNLGGQRLHPSIIGNAFEALVGAIYLDKGYEFTEKMVLKLLKKNDLNTKIHDTVDFKSQLHEWCQKGKKDLKFKVISEEQAAGKTRYEIAVMIDQKELGRGIGKSKKGAEQFAARQACEKLDVVSNGHDVK